MVYIKNMKNFLFLLLLIFLIGCFPSKRLTIGMTGLILESVGKACNKSANPEIIKSGLPAYLMLIDGLIEDWPENERLLIAGAQTYCSYAMFIEEEKRDLAKRLYLKGKRYALKVLCKNKKFKSALNKPLNEFEKVLKLFSKKYVPALFWTASCWLGYIQLSLDSVEALADLPKAISIIERVLMLNERFYYGSPHLYLGIYYAARPKSLGGNLNRAKFHFKKAFEISNGKFLMAYVFYAQYYARQKFDKKLFIETLKKVIETPQDIEPNLTLANTIAKEKAKKLLEKVDEYF